MTDSSQRLQFDLDDVPLHRRSRIWMDALNEFFYDYDHRLPAGIVNGRFTGGSIGELRIARIESDAMSVYRTASHITRDALDAYFVLLPTRQPIALTQRSREVGLRGGQFALVSTSDTYAYIQPETTTFDNLIIPGQLIRRFAPHIDDLVAIGSRDNPVSRIFYEFATSLCADFANIPAHAREVMSRQAVELLALVLDGADRVSTATPIRMAHYRRILKLIEQEYANPALNVDLLAIRLKLSTRYIQEIFTGHNTTVARVIRSRRIAEACRLLRCSLQRLYVADVAYRVGFTNLAHFSRVFKQETGYTPSHYAAGNHADNI